MSEGLISLYQAGDAFYTDNDNKWGVAGKASLDITIGAISAFGGPVGWAVSLTIGIADYAFGDDLYNWIDGTKK